MGKPYSLDLRNRVVAAVNGGMSQKRASELYSVSSKTVYNWLVLAKRQGHLKWKEGYQRGHSHSIDDLEAFRDYVGKHADQTQAEMAVHFGNSSSSISRALKKIGFSRKKRAKPILSAMRKKERFT